MCLMRRNLERNKEKETERIRNWTMEIAEKKIKAKWFQAHGMLRKSLITKKHSTVRRDIPSVDI